MRYITCFFCSNTFVHIPFRIFFDACDGIFLNYNWSIADLQHSLYLSGSERQHDVYVGVDVFGRGCFGGGGWNTYKVCIFVSHNSENDESCDFTCLIDS